MGTNEMPNITPTAMAYNRPTAVKVEKTTEFNEKNYLNVRLEKGEKKKEKRIRLLPMDLDPKSPTYGSPFFFIHQHNVPVPKEISPSGFKSYICLNKSNIDHSVYGDKCPFCELNAEAYKNAQLETDPQKKDNWKKLSWNNRLREGVIVRCIDRDNENEGVKFWKFNISSKEDDPYNQINNLYNSRMAEGLRMGQQINILDLDRGYDLIVTITEGGENTKGNTITITDAKFSSPLTNDIEQKKAWIYDSKKCFDVFKIKPYDYLSLVSVGEIPWYDRGTRTWIPKSEANIENVNKNNESNKRINEAVASFTQPAPAPAPQNDFINSLTVNNNFDDDLPY